MNEVDLTPEGKLAFAINYNHREVQRLGRQAKDLAAALGLT